MSTRAKWQKLLYFKIQHGVISPYISEKSSDFDEFLYTESDIEPGYSHWPKIAIFEIQFKMAAAAILKIVFWP